MFIARPFRCEAQRSFFVISILYLNISNFSFLISFVISHLSFLISNFISGPILRPNGNFCGLYVTGWFSGLLGLKMVVWSHFSPKLAPIYKFSVYFFFFPKSKTPNLKLEVSSINGYAVNIRQWGSYEDMGIWQLTRKWRIFYIFSTYFKNIFSFLRTSVYKNLDKNETKIKQVAEKQANSKKT